MLKDARKNPEMLHKLDLTVECSLKWFEAFEKEFGPVGTNFSDPVTCMDVISKKQFDEYSLPLSGKSRIDGTKKIRERVPGAHICGKTSPPGTTLWMQDCFHSVLTTEKILPLQKRRW